MEHLNNADIIIFTLIFMTSFVFIGIRGFYNKYNFKNLTPDEKLLTLYSESGFYYYFYKLVAEADSLKLAYQKLISSDRIEHPKEINSLQRFSISFEVITGLLFRLVRKWFKIDPLEFFLWISYCFHSILIIFVFLIALHTTNNSPLAIIAPIGLLMHFMYISRSIHAPVLKETAGIVFLYAHFYFVITNNIFLLSVMASMAILTWQFSQFVLVIETIALCLMMFLGKIDPASIFQFSIALSISTVASYYLHWKNSMILRSLLIPCLLITTIISFILYAFAIQSYAIGFLILSTVISTIGILYHFLIGDSSDSHLFAFLNKVLGRKGDFSAVLYSSDHAFQRLTKAFLWKFTRTLIAPIWLIFSLYVYLHFKSESSSTILLTILSSAFAIMTIMAYRFMLILGPMMMIIVAESCCRLTIANKTLYILILVALISYFGISELYKRLFKESKYVTSQYLTSLIDWINNNTNKNDVIAALMQYSSAITLLTNRKTIIHPHYENKELRERVEKSYEIYSSKSDKDVVDYHKSLKVDYFVVDAFYCTKTIGVNSRTVADLYPDNDNVNNRFCMRASLIEETENYLLVAKLLGMNVFKIKEAK